jgi:hypothetical protein
MLPKKRTFIRATSAVALVYPLLMAFTAWGQSQGSETGREVAIRKHLQDGEEFATPLAARRRGQILDASGSDSR